MRIERGNIEREYVTLIFHILFRSFISFIFIFHSHSPSHSSNTIQVGVGDLFLFCRLGVLFSARSRLTLSVRDGMGDAFTSTYGTPTRTAGFHGFHESVRDAPTRSDVLFVVCSKISYGQAEREVEPGTRRAASRALLAQTLLPDCRCFSLSSVTFIPPTLFLGPSAPSNDLQLAELLNTAVLLNSHFRTFDALLDRLSPLEHLPFSIIPPLFESER